MTYYTPYNIVYTCNITIISTDEHVNALTVNVNNCLMELHCVPIFPVKQETESSTLNGKIIRRLLYHLPDRFEYINDQASHSFKHLLTSITIHEYRELY